MFNGLKKAVTFSYDDGVVQDRRLIAMFDKYGLKATFNLNSGLFGQTSKIHRNNIDLDHTRFSADEIREVYRGHEVAAHTLTHPLLPELEEEEIIRQVDCDRRNLEELAGYPVCGMAYPCGGQNNDDRVAGIIGRCTPIRYARTIVSSYSFDLQSNILRFNPTVHHMEFDRLFSLGDEFISLKPDTPKIFYIWGHSYEFDYRPEYWDRMEEFCRMISRHEDIFYGTNSEVLLNEPPVPAV